MTAESPDPAELPGFGGGASRVSVPGVVLLNGAAQGWFKICGQAPELGIYVVRAARARYTSNT
jgi:hypothetical protein